MPQTRMHMVLTDTDGGVVVGEHEVDKTFDFAEKLDHRLNLKPDDTVTDLTAILAQMGAPTKIKALFVSSDIDGVLVQLKTMADLATDDDNIVVTGAYPFFFTASEAGMSVATPFEFGVVLPVAASDETAHLRVIAFY